VSSRYDDEGFPEMTEKRTDAIREALTEHLKIGPAARRRKRRLWLAFGGGVGVVVLGGAAIAAAAIVSSQRITNRDSVYCFASAERGANGEFEMSGATLYSPSGRGRVEDAVDLCRTMWRQGVFNKDSDPLAQTNPPGDVPGELQVCVMEDGAAAVVPGRPGVCQAVGLAPERSD